MSTLSINSTDSRALIEHLKYWTDRLVRIAMEKKSVYCKLADLGVIPKVPFTVHPTDSQMVAGLKGRLKAMRRERDRIVRDMAEAGAEILDDETMEIVFPGGPLLSSVLSWMPGEPRVGFWRKRRDVSCERHPLLKNRRRICRPIIH